jgi:putative addiction module killer protein
VAGAVAELRIDHGPGYRVYFMRWKADIVILLAGGTKSSQLRDIRRARALAATLEVNE